MLTEYSLKLPNAVYGGANAIEQIKNIIPENVKKIAIFTDKTIQKMGLLDRTLEILLEIKKETIIFNQIPSEATCDEAQLVIDEFHKSQAEYIVAIGGGSVIDIAKLASVLSAGKYGVRDLLENSLLGTKQVKTLIIPTTAGTGAEATPNSIVVVPEQELKVGIVNEQMVADAVILDGSMLENLPRKIAAATGVDALSHAIECYTSKRANIFSDTYSLQAMDLILNNIENFFDNPKDTVAGTAMLTGAFYAGIAITASGTTAVHALSYPLGGKYHIPHGVSNAMLLSPVMQFNKQACNERLADIYDRVTHKTGSLETCSHKADWVINKIDSIVKHLQIPCFLNEYGVAKGDIEMLVVAGMAVQRLLANNMRKVTANDARNIYSQIIR